MRQRKNLDLNALLLVNMSCIPTVGRASDRFAFANSSSGSKVTLALLTTSLPLSCSSLRLKENWSYFKTIGLQDGELYFKICKLSADEEKFLHDVDNVFVANHNNS